MFRGNEIPTNPVPVSASEATIGQETRSHVARFTDMGYDWVFSLGDARMSGETQIQIADANAAANRLDDNALLRRYVEQDDRVALESLFRRHADAAYATAMRICRNSADAEDAVQTAMINVMRNAANYRGGSDIGVRVWIMKIVVGSCKERIRSEVRRRAREEKASATQDDAYSQPESFGDETSAAAAKAVFDALNELPEHHRMAIWLHHYQGMSLQEAASALSVSENTLHAHIIRGMKKLRKTLESRRIEMPVASLAAIMPLLHVETAPQSLLAGLSELAAGKMPVPVATTGTGREVFLTWSIARRAAAIVLILGGCAAVYLALTQTPAVKPAEPAVPPPGLKGFSYRWDFNQQGIPPEFKVMAGNPLKHLPGEGPDKSGCLEMVDGAVVRIDVPVISFPFRVNFKSATVDPLTAKSMILKSHWLPARDLGIFMGVSKIPREDVLPGQKYSKWLDHVEYNNGAWIFRSRGEYFSDITVYRPGLDGRVTLALIGHAVIDDLEISSITTNELPDASIYLQALEQIPLNKRTGTAKATLRGGKPISIQFSSSADEKGKCVEAK
ncbi:MAG: hypothetical protein C0404_01260 [Verrucomicrobia bacterium]|nr:hypothetical protein [Verrucomicrobiota bacterium]